MSENSKIEWTDASWNPVVGCSVVSPGCTHCYAMRDAWRKHHNPKLRHYHGLTKKVNGNPVWTGIVRQAPERILTAPLRWCEPRMVFVNSMSDLFHEDIPDEWIDRVFAVMALAPQHTFQVLTKRAERLREWFAERWQPAPALNITVGKDTYNLPAEREGDDRHERVYQACESIFDLIPAMADTNNDALWNERGSLKCRDFKWPLPNVWLGVSAERQQEADARIPHLRETSAAVRFISFEPLLGRIEADLHNIDWAIVGGESGPKARGCWTPHVRSIVKQCRKAGVPIFVKQMGSYVMDRNDAGFDGDGPDEWEVDYGNVEHDLDGYADNYQGAPVRIRLRDRKGGDPAEWPADLRVREMPIARAA